MIYDENTQKFTPGGLMNTWRNGFPAVLLPSGKVFMTGAKRGPNLDGDQTAELYDPNSFGFQLSAYRSDPVFAVAVDPTTNGGTENGGRQSISKLTFLGGALKPDP